MYFEKFMSIHNYFQQLFYYLISQFYGTFPANYFPCIESHMKIIHNYFPMNTLH